VTKTTSVRRISNNGDAGYTALHDRVRELVDRVRLQGGERMAAWSSMIERQSFGPAAENLACYLALRSEDLSELQLDLSESGLSSLGRCEANVMGNLDAVAAVLARISGANANGLPPAGRKRPRDAALQEQVKAIFGRDPSGPRSRIMVTLGTDAAGNARLVGSMIAAGADCVRINCAHDGPDVWEAMINVTRRAAAKLGRDCRVLMDIAGPKIRIASVAGSRGKRVHLGDRFTLVGDTGRAADHRGLVTVCSETEVFRLLEDGHKVLVDDGKIVCVVEKKGKERAKLRVEAVRPKGVKLRPGKGLNFPDLDLSIPPLTAKDLVDLDFVAAHADVVGFSFVQRPTDVKLLQSELAKRLGKKPLPPLILKVETRLGVANLPDLIVAAAGRQPTAVMIARGDLAVELGLQQMSEVQEQLLWLCEAAHVPVVWATQVLDNLLKTGIPSRAEATDAAMAQRAECVMLNKGEHVVDAVRFLDNILHRMDRHVAKKSALLGPLALWSTRADHRRAPASRRSSSACSRKERGS
jgi:pyruvate kinase